MPVFNKTVRFDHSDILWGGGFLATAACLPFLAPNGIVQPAYAFVFLCCFLSLFHFLFKSGLRHLTNATFLFSLIFFIGLGLRLLYVQHYPTGTSITDALWYGMLQLQGYAPSTFMPGVSDLAELSSGPLANMLAQVPYPDGPSSAGPLTLLLWHGAAWLSPTTLCFKLVSVILRQPGLCGPGPDPAEAPPARDLVRTLLAQPPCDQLRCRRRLRSIPCAFVSLPGNSCVFIAT